MFFCIYLVDLFSSRFAFDMYTRKLLFQRQNKNKSVDHPFWEISKFYFSNSGLKICINVSVKLK